ncbi:MAG: GGDEF domain-containing protein [Pirellulales bacterium]|nr:GGDEF domain-containing protein [Pirellulales bacterium]
MDSLAYIVPWVLGSVGVGIVAGYYLSRTAPHRSEGEQAAERERQATLGVLTEILGSIQRMTSQVEDHTTEIQQAAHHVGNLRTSGEMETIKQALMGHIGTLLASNQRLTKDLTYSRYKMEEQAGQIDDARREARTDPLTAVANRKALDEKLHLFLADWERERRPFAMVLIDLDHFKRINDSHGHQAGDHVLAEVGRWLRQWTREGDFVGRYGGDEFVVLCAQAELAVAVELAETIRRQTVDQAIRLALGGEQVSISFSTGVAVSRPGDTVASLLARADQALYKSKRLGRNQVQAEEPAEQEEHALAVAAAG